MGGMEWTGVHALVQRARLGDREAMAELFKLAQPYLLGLAQKLLGPGWPHKSVSDLTQETWVRAWQGLPSFHGANNDVDTGALLRAWLARTMKNVRLNEARFDAAQCRRPPAGTKALDAGAAGDSTTIGGDPPACDASPSENARRNERQDLIQQAMHELSEADAEIVRLRFFEGLSFAEIGQRLGRDESTVRYHVQRVLEQLGRQLKDLQ
jgi:RNA polymerase sigma-70 factor, ECF subfamily